MVGKPISENLPSFLVIGGMKCGSTSLYDDLSRVGGVSLPEKDPNHFLSSSSTTETALARYANSFRGVGIRGEVSTGYSQLPLHAGVAARARSALGPDVRIVYMVREPLERMLSHHHHLRNLGQAPDDFQTAVSGDETYLSFSQYDVQAQPWLDAFGEDHVHVSVLERYAASVAELNSILDFIGVPPVDDEFATSVSNDTSTNPVLRGWTASLYHSRVFQEGYVKRVRPKVPRDLRTQLRRRFLPGPSEPERALPSGEYLESLAEKLVQSVEFVDSVAGPTGWDLARSVEELSS